MRDRRGREKSRLSRGSNSGCFYRHRWPRAESAASDLFTGCFQAVCQREGIKTAQGFSEKSRISVVVVGVLDANVSRETFLVQEEENASKDGRFSRVVIGETSIGAESFGESANNRCGSWGIRRECFR